MIEAPQPGMFQGWMEWANQLLLALRQYKPSPLEIKGDFADDAAAAAGGVDVGEFYRSGSVVKVRVT